MGNNIIERKDSFYMHVKCIGRNIQAFYDEFRKSNTLKKIIKYWDIDPLQKIDGTTQINNYFDILKNYKDDINNKDINIKECLVLKIK